MATVNNSPTISLPCTKQLESCEGASQLRREESLHAVWSAPKDIGTQEMHCRCKDTDLALRNLNCPTLQNLAPLFHVTSVAARGHLPNASAATVARKIQTTIVASSTAFGIRQSARITPRHRVSHQLTTRHITTHHTARRCGIPGPDASRNETTTASSATQVRMRSTTTPRSHDRARPHRPAPTARSVRSPANSRPNCCAIASGCRIPHTEWLRFVSAPAPQNGCWGRGPLRSARAP